MPAFVIIFFFRCPMLTFNDLPHFLPLLYLIIDCDLHTHTLSRSHSLYFLPPSPSPSSSLTALSHFRFQSIDQSLFLPLLGIEQFAFRSLALYLFVNKWKRYCWQRTFVSLQTTIHLSQNGGIRSNITRIFAHCMYVTLHVNFIGRFITAEFSMFNIER